ncbi:hypothetical protein KY289_023557 [Solanum tuberosum]|nr:hypothetical protein KY289_023557 [Solanum tuberosum]
MAKRERTLSLKEMEAQASQPNRGNRKKNGKASANFGKKSSSSGGRSWTDEVDDDSVKPVHQSSIWDNFDKTKISNVRSSFLVLIFKYWSPKGLSKIGSLVGKPVMVNYNTERKVRLNFARLLVEVQMDTMLSEVILSRLEKGYLKETKMLYDWKPTLCKICDKYGHSEVNYRKKNTCLGTKKGGTGSKGDVGQDIQPSIDIGGIVVQEKISPPTIALDPLKAGISDESQKQGATNGSHL